MTLNFPNLFYKTQEEFDLHLRAFVDFCIVNSGPVDFNGRQILQDDIPNLTSDELEALEKQLQPIYKKIISAPEFDKKPE